MLHTTPHLSTLHLLRHRTAKQLLPTMNTRMSRHVLIIFVCAVAHTRRVTSILSPCLLRFSGILGQIRQRKKNSTTARCWVQCSIRPCVDNYTHPPCPPYRRWSKNYQGSHDRSLRYLDSIFLYYSHERHTRIRPSTIYRRRIGFASIQSCPRSNHRTYRSHNRPQYTCRRNRSWSAQPDYSGYLARPVPPPASQPGVDC